MSGDTSTASSSSGRRERTLRPLLHNNSRDAVEERSSGDAETGAHGTHTIYESPTTFSTQSVRSQLSQLATIRTRKRTAPATATPRSAQAIEQQLERRTRDIADRSISKAIRRSILHILPVLITIILVTLNAGKVYMSDLAGFRGQDVVLQLFQFVVKAHEILMLMSLGDIVLHRIRWDLIAGTGMPFGLFSSAYQLSDIGYLFSNEFWTGIWKPRSHDPSFSRLTLALLVTVSCILSSVVGPSSGVLLIPRLAWWPLERPFGSITLRVFNSNSTRDQYWPNPLREYTCSPGWNCPADSAFSVKTWAWSLRYTDTTGQVPFVDGSSNFYRWVISNATDHGGWTAATTSMTAIGNLIGEYWNWISYEHLEPTISSKQPRLSLVLVDNESALQPVVQVQCSAHSSNHTQTDLRFPNSQLRTGNTYPFTNVTWPVPSSYSDVNLFDYNVTANLYAARLPLHDFNNPPSALWVFVAINQNYTKTVIPCSILAHWVPSESSIIPKTDRTIYNANSNPIEVINGENISRSAQLNMTDTWWEMFRYYDDNGAPHSYLSYIPQGFSQNISGSHLIQYLGGAQGLPYRFSSVIGMYLTDAIARHTPVTNHTIVQDPNNGSAPFAYNLVDFYQRLESPTGSETWLEYAEKNPDKWQEATLTVSRYGYAWSFSGVLSGFAAAALLAQSLLALAHVALVLHGRWTSSAWDSIGSMVALALRSHSPAAPSVDKKGREKEETWAETVSVRVIDDELELVFNPVRAEELRPTPH